MMIVNHHFATGALFRPDFLADAAGLPLLAALAALVAAAPERVAASDDLFYEPSSSAASLSSCAAKSPPTARCSEPVPARAV